MDMRKDMMHMDMHLPRILTCIMVAILDMGTISNQELTHSHSRLVKNKSLGLASCIALGKGVANWIWSSK